MFVNSLKLIITSWLYQIDIVCKTKIPIVGVIVVHTYKCDIGELIWYNALQH